MRWKKIEKELRVNHLRVCRSFPYPDERQNGKGSLLWPLHQIQWLRRPHMQCPNDVLTSRLGLLQYRGVDSDRVSSEPLDPNLLFHQRPEGYSQLLYQRI